MTKHVRSSLLVAGLVVCGCETFTGSRDVELDPSIVCDRGACVCREGLADCDGAGVACETDLLTRSEHCGACGHSCGGGTCREGRCEPVAIFVSTSDRADDCAASGDHLYIPDREGMVIDVVLGGGASPATPAKGVGKGVALHEDTLFYAGLVSGEWQLFQGPRGDLGSHTLITQGGWFNDKELAVIGATAGHVLAARPAYGPLYRLPRAQPSAAEQLSEKYWGISQLPDRIYWSRQFDISLEDGVFMIRDGDAAPQRLTDLPAGDILLMQGIVGDLSFVYYSVYEPDALEMVLLRVSVEDKSQEEIFRTKTMHNYATIGMDASYLYFTADVSGQATLLRLDRAASGSAPRVLASVGALGPLHVVNHGIYWTSQVFDQSNSAEGAVVSYLAKPLD